jgi:uncharacterized cupin superfamily protein
MIIKRGQGRLEIATAEQAKRHGRFTSARLSEDGGLTQFGAYVETLDPGARSSERHWHEREDEFLHVLSGEATVIENDGEHLLLPGDTACWPAGVDDAHHVVNRSTAPCSYLIVGTRVGDDVCHYPDSGTTLYTEGETWRVVDAEGNVVRSGRV